MREAGSSPPEREAREVAKELESARAERGHWKANHDDQVRRKQAVQDRYDEARAALLRIAYESTPNDAGAVETMKRIAREALDRLDRAPSDCSHDERGEEDGR